MSLTVGEPLLTLSTLPTLNTAGPVIAVDAINATDTANTIRAAAAVYMAIFAVDIFAAFDRQQGMPALCSWRAANHSETEIIDPLNRPSGG